MTDSPLWDTEQVSTIIDSLKSEPGALLPILHGIQNSQGFVPQGAHELIASALNLSRAEVHGVVSFYHHFRAAPAGRHRLQICRAESCQAMGSRDLEQHAKTALKIDYHQTTADGEFTLEPVYCLGNCACSPALRVGDKVYGHVDSERFDKLLSQLTTHAVEVQ